MRRELFNKNSKRLEIERKFLVKSSDWLGGHKGISYKQGYLSTEASRTVRIRLEGERGKLTIKGKKKGIAGVEFEYRSVSRRNRTDCQRVQPFHKADSKLFTYCESEVKKPAWRGLVSLIRYSILE